MSFDVFLKRFENRQLAAADRDAVHPTLATRNFTDLSGDGYYSVRFPDGSDVEFAGPEGESDLDGCAFFIPGISTEIIRKSRSSLYSVKNR
jgi:hypothetical protein